MNRPVSGATIARTFSAHRTRIVAAVLAAGWTLIFADDLDVINLPMSLRLHADLLWLLGASTIMLAVPGMLRARLMYESMRLGRRIEQEATRRQQQRISQEITVGIGLN